MPGHNAIWGHLSQVNEDDRPRSYYFGHLANASLCQEKCGMERGCYAFAFGLAGMGPVWENQCHGRGFGAPETLKPAPYTSGLKLC